MVNKNIVDTTLEQAREWGNALYLSDGLVLTDKIAHASISKEPIRLNFILMALCRKGKASYNIDTCEQTVLPGDLFFISERHIVDNFQSSDDFECLYIMLSTQFYHNGRTALARARMMLRVDALGLAVLKKEES